MVYQAWVFRRAEGRRSYELAPRRVRPRTADHRLRDWRRPVRHGWERPPSGEDCRLSASIRSHVQRDGVPARRGRGRHALGDRVRPHFRCGARRHRPSPRIRDSRSGCLPPVAPSEVQGGARIRGPRREVGLRSSMGHPRARVFHRPRARSHRPGALRARGHGVWGAPRTDRAHVPYGAILGRVGPLATERIETTVPRRWFRSGGDARVGIRTPDTRLRRPEPYPG